ncbi:hypothetical protein DsansV1_C04g0044481 [Dioscorea sansibarensis]
MTCHQISHKYLHSWKYHSFLAHVRHSEIYDSRVHPSFQFPLAFQKPSVRI